MKRKWIAALLAGCMLAALLLTGCSAAETVKRLRFGVAGEGGVYHNFGEQFAALENETSNGTIELRTTAGSAANLRLLTGEYLQLAELALPLVVLLAGQTLFMILYSFVIVYNVMGRDYDAAVIVSGTCGFGMGATPNAMANMQAVCDKYSPSVKAYLLIPLVGSLFADFINSLVITVFINFI